MKPTAQSAFINQKPFNGLSSNYTSTTESARYAQRRVKKQSGLLNAINSIISYVKNSFRALEDFVCESCTWHDAANVGQKMKHNAKKSYNKYRVATATSKTEEAKYKAKIALGEVQYQTSKVKNLFDNFIK